MRNVAYHFIGFFFLLSAQAYSQGYVTQVRDQKNATGEYTNMAGRLIADGITLKFLNKIEESKKVALENLTIVEQIQKRVYNSLTTVDKTIKQGKNVIDAKNIITDILKYQLMAAEYAKNDPVLVLFVERQERDFKNRGLDLILFIENFIMAEKTDVLMDVGKRDKLLAHVIVELRVLRALAYSAKMQLYWARMDGIFRALNPWQKYIDKDLNMGQEILRNFKF